jgi:hypothetical protein
MLLRAALAKVDFKQLGHWENAMASGDDSGSGTRRPVIARRAPFVTPPVNPDIVARPGDVAVPVIPLPVDFVGNLFEPGRPGAAVVRPDDLLALRVERQNLDIVPGSPPRLVKAGRGAARLILHFPPQAITEETFFEIRSWPDPHAPIGPPPPVNNPAPLRPGEPGSDPQGGSEMPHAPPVRARVAGESRLAFDVPDGFDVPYTLAGVLEACRTLALSVAANAAAAAPSRLVVNAADLFERDQVRALPARQRAALASFAVRSLRIVAVQGDTATVSLRQSSAGGALRAIAVGRVSDLVIPRDPQPALPTAAMTSIELPWRLILSPHGAERWRHATAPVTSTATGHTELWHSRLVAPDRDGRVIEPPHPDPDRTVRAIWALSGEGSPVPMQSQWPNSLADLPKPNDPPNPFRTPMEDFDRFQIAHLSSNFSATNYTPQSVGTNLMMLSALGGWLDSRGSWDPPGLSVEEWVHRASMARDHYVKIVYRGFLFPFGHRVSLIKVSERKFHNGAKDGNGQPVVDQIAGNGAYLRQRLFLVVREYERTFDDPAYAQLKTMAGDAMQRELPFSTIRILTQVTPNLDRPGLSQVLNYGQTMFWPFVNGQPFRFQCVAIDLDGRNVAFDLPMIFMDNTVACPRHYDATTKKLQPDWVPAEQHAVDAKKAFEADGAKRTAHLKLQRVALATSLKPGDTSVQVDTMTFGGEAEVFNMGLRAASDGLNRPVFFPRVVETTVRIGALAHLTGSSGTNTLTWNAHYLRQGFDANKAEVFADVAPAGAVLDFSAQGDHSGGYVQPNLKPRALSRLAGPVMGDVNQFISGTVDPGLGFPKSGDPPLADLPLPLLFGCIPLGDLVKGVADVAGAADKIPKFASEATNKVESFINALARLYGFVSDLASKPGSIAEGAASGFRKTIEDLRGQAAAYSAAQMAPVRTALTQIDTALGNVVTQAHALAGALISDAPALPQLAGLPGSIATARADISQLVTAANAKVGGVALPSGFRQTLLSYAQQVDSFLVDLQTIPALIGQGKTLFDALDAIVGQPDQIGTLLSDPATLNTRVAAVAAAIGSLKTTLGTVHLLDGAPRKTVIDAMTAVEEILGGDLSTLIAMLAGEELTVRFDWNPEIDNWWLPNVSHANLDDAIFRANDTRGFLVAVEAKVKKNGSSSPKISVVCGLKQFDLVLIAPASFLELNFQKIEFRVDSAAKMDVDVLMSGIKFVGPLSFVETLRDLIPLDGFSDPPHLDITAKGIDAGFSVALPGIPLGVMSLTNLSLGAGFTVPFIGQPLSVRFNFCTREQPFCLTVYVFGGGGSFGVAIDPHGVQLLEASFEFGASVSIDLGVASGGVHVMAGIYYRMEQDAASLAGYFRLGGNVDVLGIITASLELYLELKYEFQSGKCTGKAELTIEISLFIFSGSVTVSCERKFAGSNGDPTLRQMLGFRPDLPLVQELALIDANTNYAWREHCEAFA